MLHMSSDVELIEKGGIEPTRPSPFAKKVTNHACMFTYQDITIY